VSARAAGRWPVAVLGATGMVGQTFVRLLAGHPWFELTELAASERSVGQRYGDAVRWSEATLADEVARLPVLPCDPASITAPVVFSALDAATAVGAEAAFARAGRVVLSNARSYRLEPDVPLVIAEVNPGHLDILDAQRRRRGWSGAIVTNGNCATIVGAMALAPLHERFGVRRVVLTTMQAISGAGYPGVPSLEILGNVIPFIADEEPKVEAETRKFLGALRADAIADAPIAVSAHCNRVPVEHGHMVCLSVELAVPVSPADARAALCAWRGAEVARDLPSAPDRPLILTDQADRPQPRRDVDAGGGMSVTVGRVREDPVLGLRLVALGHNTVRGAAGASILNAELMAARRLLPAP
jgi:aspartate-semialdehyde dehydrogenase